MLLSFFIILNAHSTFEVSKSQTVLNSLSSAFAIDREIVLSAPSDIASLNQSIHEGSVLDNLQSYFTAQIIDVQARQNRLGTEMHMRMPFENFKNAVDSALIPQKDSSRPDNVDRSFLLTLVSVMDTQNAVPYRMDMMVSSAVSPEKLVAQNPEKYRVMSAEISEIAKRLEAAGMPGKFMSVGIGSGQEGMVDLYFRRHQAFILPEAQKEGGS